MTDDERATRLRELDEGEAHARDTLRKLHYPKSALDYAWWGATWFSNTRSAWSSAAYRALAQIADEREKLAATSVTGDTTDVLRSASEPEGTVTQHYPPLEGDVELLPMCEAVPPYVSFRVKNYSGYDLRELHLQLDFELLPAIHIAIQTLPTNYISAEFPFAEAAQSQFGSEAANRIQNELRQLALGTADGSRRRAINFTYVDYRGVRRGASIRLPVGAPQRATLKYEQLPVDTRQ